MAGKSRCRIPPYNTNKSEKAPAHESYRTSQTALNLEGETIRSQGNRETAQDAKDGEGRVDEMQNAATRSGKVKRPANDAPDTAIEDVETDAQGQLPLDPKLFLIVFSLMLAVFCMALDNTIISVAVPRITDQFHALSDASWYVTAYLLTSCARWSVHGQDDLAMMLLHQPADRAASLSRSFAPPQAEVTKDAEHVSGTHHRGIRSSWNGSGHWMFFQRYATIPARAVPQQSVVGSLLFVFVGAGAFFIPIFYIPIWGRTIGERVSITAISRCSRPGANGRGSRAPALQQLQAIFSTSAVKAAI
ncbi:hypothetical protein VTO42DRAFT_5399 [Malbranchea cinnamomea]